MSEDHIPYETVKAADGLLYRANLRCAPPDKPRCENCPAWEPMLGDLDNGECRAGPPEVKGWPKLRAEAFCYRHPMLRLKMEPKEDGQ